MINTAPGGPDRVENGVGIPGDTYLTFDTSESDSEESDRVPSPTEQVQPRPVENDATSTMQDPIESPIARVLRSCGLESLSFNNAMAQRAIQTAEEGLSKNASTELRTRTVDVALIRVELLTRLQKSGKFLLPDGADTVMKTMREPGQAHYDTDLGKAFRTLWELLDNDAEITVESFERALNRLEASEAREIPPPLPKAEPMPEGLVAQYQLARLMAPAKPDSPPRFGRRGKGDVALIKVELATRLQKSGKFFLPDGADSVMKTMREPGQDHYNTELGKAFRTLKELLDKNEAITHRKP